MALPARGRKGTPRCRRQQPAPAPARTMWTLRWPCRTPPCRPGTCGPCTHSWAPGSRASFPPWWTLRDVLFVSGPPKQRRKQPSSAHTQRSPFRPPLRRTNVRARRADAQDRLYAPPVEGCGGKERRARVRQGVKRVASGQRARAHCTSGAFQTAAHQVTNRGPRVEGPTSSHERLCPLLRQHDDLPRVSHELEARRQEDDEAPVALAVVPSSPNVRPGAPCAAACAPHSYTQPAHPTLAMC